MNIKDTDQLAGLSVCCSHAVDVNDDAHIIMGKSRIHFNHNNRHKMYK